MRETNLQPASNIVQLVRPAPLLEARGLTYERNGAQLINNVDLSLDEAKRTLILGANGSGKSLLLRLLHGLIAPHAGEILWRGGPLTKRARSEQAMVFQKPVMLRRSVRANLKFALAARGIGGAERQRRCDEALALARLEDMAQRPARVLSGGEQQRLAIARAVVLNPKLLFLDEPTASLDPASSALIEELILAAGDRGVGVVMISHDRGQAARLAEDIVFMHGGEIVERGTASRVLGAPASGAAEAWLSGDLFV